MGGEQCEMFRKSVLLRVEDREGLGSSGVGSLGSGDPSNPWGTGLRMKDYSVMVRRRGHIYLWDVDESIDTKSLVNVGAEMK